eukprot:gene17422-gene1441
MTLIVISSRQDFLTGRSQNQCMLVLGGVAALLVTQRWVGVDDTRIAESLQLHQMACLTSPTSVFFLAILGRASQG